MSIDFRAHLSRQLDFLWRSCDAYDQGFVDEAVRIATVIRILIHDTPQSTSLLSHLNATTIGLSSTVSDVDRSKAVFLTSMGRLKVTPTSADWSANTDIDSISGQVPVQQWWNQLVYVAGEVRATRRNLVLGAANRDGGAHVDTKLTREYETLMNTGSLGWFHFSHNGEPGTFQPIMNAHLVYLRQMGFELLNSPDLLALAKVNVT